MMCYSYMKEDDEESQESDFEDLDTYQSEKDDQ